MLNLLVSLLSGVKCRGCGAVAKCCQWRPLEVGSGDNFEGIVKFKCKRFEFTAVKVKNTRFRDRREMQIKHGKMGRLPLLGKPLCSMAAVHDGNV